jgi:hypothetical protein
MALDADLRTGDHMIFWAAQVTRLGEEAIVLIAVLQTLQVDLSVCPSQAIRLI